MNITGGVLNSRKIKIPPQENIKPTLSKIRQGIFNSLSTLIDFEGKSFLDMFSGSGIMSFEAYSRGFKVTGFEKDKLSLLGIRNNAKILGIEGLFLQGNAVKLISKCIKPFDIIYLDPPYESELYDKALKVIKAEGHLNVNGLIVLERKEEKIIDYSGYKVIKTKNYADKVIEFLKIEEIHA